MLNCYFMVTMDYKTKGKAWSLEMLLATQGEFQHFLANNDGIFHCVCLHNPNCFAVCSFLMWALNKELAQAFPVQTLSSFSHMPLLSMLFWIQILFSLLLIWLHELTHAGKDPRPLQGFSAGWNREGINKTQSVSQRSLPPFLHLCWAHTG